MTAPRRWSRQTVPVAPARTIALTLSALATLAACSASGQSPGASGDASSAGSASSGGGSAIGGGAVGGQGGAQSVATGSGGVSPDACEKLCNLFTQLDCQLADCASQCPQWVKHAGDCGPLMMAEIDCIADSTTQCGQDVCHAEYAALDRCADGIPCFGQSCTGDHAGGVDTCACATGCSTGRLEVSCTTVNDGPTECQCFVGGNEVGKCVDSDTICQVGHSCCDTFF